MFDVYFWSVIAFFAILIYAIYRDRKNLEFHGIKKVPLLVMKKTKRGKKLLDRIARSSPIVTKSWNVLATIAVVFAFVYMAYGLYLITLSAYYVARGDIDVPAVQLVLPIPQPQPITGIGFIGVPFWFWILIIPFVLFPHEFAHGVIARANGIRIKTVGLIQLLIWPGGFVEPDEAQIRKSSLIKQLRVFSVGSMANIVTAIFLVYVTTNFLWPSFISDGVLITHVEEGYGAEAAGLRPGMVLQEIDGHEVKVGYDGFSWAYSTLLSPSVKNVTTENLKVYSGVLEIFRSLRDNEPNQTIEVVADGMTFELKLSGRPESPETPYMGIEARIISNSDSMLEYAFPLVWWLSSIGLLVAIFNILPIYPLDGGLMVEAVAQRVSKKYAKRITMAITFSVTAILVFSFVYPLLV